MTPTARAVEMTAERALVERLVLALVEALVEGDPVVTIAVGGKTLSVSWGVEVKSSPTVNGDTLRDRYCTCGQWSGDSTGTRIDFSRHLADAVIRELGLPPTWGRPSFENGSNDD